MINNLFFILTSENEVLRAVDMIDHNDWMVNNQHRLIVAKDKIENIEVSTVFLGVNYSPSSKTPIVFETMIFGDLSLANKRYSSYKEAEEGHRLIVEELTLKKLTHKD